MEFTEAQLEQAFITLLGEQGYPHVSGEELLRGKEEVLIKGDLQGAVPMNSAISGRRAGGGRKANCKLVWISG